MANADEFCQFARLGQTAKIQKCLQTHSVDINALNLYGESALSIATYYNQILAVEYLLANKADPKLRLAAGHTAVHIACRLGNIPILHLLLSIKKDDNNNEVEEEQKQQQREDKHIYDCLRIQDHSNLTPIHWAGTQESVSKRQKTFAYLDQRMPGVLDSRYNTDWFHSWAKIHSWVIEQKTIKNILSLYEHTSPIRFQPKLTNTDRTYRQERSSLPLSHLTPLDMSPRTSINNYERRPRRPPTATTIGCYEDILEKNTQYSSKNRAVKIEQPPQAPNLPSTPTTSCIITSTYHIPNQEHQQLKSPEIFEYRDLPRTQKQSSISKNITANPQKTPYSQRLNSMVAKLSLSPLSDRSTYRAERAHVIPTSSYPSSPSDIPNKNNKGHDYEDMMTPISSKRPSHNLLSNIVPSTTTPSSDRSSQQSTKPFASFGFDPSLDQRGINDTTILSMTDTSTQNDDEENELESLLNDEENDYESNQFDYLCKSASTLGVSSPGAYVYDV